MEARLHASPGTPSCQLRCMMSSLTTVLDAAGVGLVQALLAVRLVHGACAWIEKHGYGQIGSKHQAVQCKELGCVFGCVPASVPAMPQAHPTHAHSRTCTGLSADGCAQPGSLQRGGGGGHSADWCRQAGGAGSSGGALWGMGGRAAGLAVGR